MDDMTLCPICGNKLRNLNLKNKYFHSTGKTADLIERTCSKGKNHSLQFFTDLSTNKIDYIKFSLDPKYSKYIEINFINNECIIMFMKNGTANNIVVPKIIEPDFPDLFKLKQQVNLYAVFS
jgi:hypothetical protein